MPKPKEPPTDERLERIRWHLNPTEEHPRVPLVRDDLAWLVASYVAAVSGCEQLAEGLEQMTGKLARLESEQRTLTLKHPRMSRREELVRVATAFAIEEDPVSAIKSGRELLEHIDDWESEGHPKLDPPLAKDVDCCPFQRAAGLHGADCFDLGREDCTGLNRVRGEDT